MSPSPSSPRYRGLIHFEAGYSFLEIADKEKWAVLMDDPSHTRAFNSAIAAQTMARMEQKYQEGDSATLTGAIVIQQALGNRQQPVLHLDHPDQLD
jgi:hypothetical protein